MARQTKQDKLIAQLREQIVDLNEEANAYFVSEQEIFNRLDAQIDKVEELEAEANDLFDESAAFENDRDYYKALYDELYSITASAFDQRDEAEAALEETKAKLAHAQDAIASLLLSI